MELKFTIYLNPITKKNSSQIIKHGNRSMIIPSKQYKQFEKDCKIFMPKCETITKPINLKTVYYMPTRRRVDLTNLMAATHDILTKYEVIQDDNANIIKSVDGSRVFYDKENPRTDITITEVENEN